MATVLEKYRKLGISLVPMKIGTKIPAGQWGSKTYEEKDFEGKDYALKLGDEFCVLDIEGPKKSVNGMHLFENVIASDHRFPETINWNSPSGGLGFLFRCKPMPLLNRSSDLGIELRTGMAVHKIPPSVGYCYNIEDVDEIPFVPDWIIEFLQKPVSQVETAGDDESRRNLVESALTVIPAPEDYLMWFRVGMALKSAQADFYDLFLGWSLKSKREKDLQCDHRKFWDELEPKSISLGTLFHLARKHGWKAPEQEVVLPPECREHPLPTGPALTVLPEPVGLIKELRDFIFEQTKQLQFSLAGALFILTAALQRAVKYPIALQNCYYVLIAPSGAGKTKTQNIVEQIISACNLCAPLGDPRSIGAFKSELHQNPSRYLLIDEWGQELRQHVYVKNPTQQNMEKVQMFLQLHGDMRVMPAHSTMTKVVIPAVIEPRVSIFATGTLNDFIALSGKREFLTTGLASRLVVWQGEKLPYEPFNLVSQRMTIPLRLQEKLKFYNTLVGKVGVLPEADEYITQMHATKWRELFETSEDDIYSIINRSFYAGIQFACLSALGQNEFEVNLEDAKFGQELAYALCLQMIQSFNLGQTDATELAVQAALDFIAVNRRVTWRDTYRKVGMLRKADSPFRSNVLRALKETGKVKICPKSGQITLTHL